MTFKDLIHGSLVYFVIGARCLVFSDDRSLSDRVASNWPSDIEIPSVLLSPEVLDSEGSIISSEGEHPDFQLELSIFRLRRPPAVARVVAASRSDHVAFAAFGPSRRIERLLIDSDSLSFSKPGSWKLRSEAKWSIRMPGDQPLTDSTPINVFDGLSAPKRGGGLISYSVSTHVDSVLGDHLREVRWDPNSTSLLLSGMGERTARISLRTPSDTELLGSPLSEVIGWNSEHGVTMRNLVIGQPRTGFDIHIDMASEDDGIAKDLLESIDGVGWDAGHTKLWDLLAGHKQTYSHFHKMQNFRQSFFKFALQLIGKKNPAISPTLTSSARQEDLKLAIATVNTALREISEMIAKHFGTEMLDDPFARWRQLEVLLGIELLRHFEINATKQILEADVTIDSKILLAAAWSDAGRSPHSVGNNVEYRTNEQLLLSAITQCRWRQPCTETGAVACRRQMDSLGRESPAWCTLAESLMYMDRFDLLSAGEKSEYFRVVVGGNAVGRMDKIRRLSLTAAGRAFLLETLEALDKFNCHGMILNVLAHRAAATRRTKRWDFMTKNECKQIEVAVGAAFAASKP